MLQSFYVPLQVIMKLKTTNRNMVIAGARPLHGVIGELDRVLLLLASTLCSGSPSL
jgi:hypothetical protein